MSHSGCGCERVSRQKGKRYRRRGGTERIEGEEERNGAGKVFSHGVGGEKGRKLMVPGVVPPSSFFFLSSSSLLTLPLLLPFPPLQLSP